MSVLGLPIDLPVRTLNRAFNDLRIIARIALEMPERLDALDRRAEQILRRVDALLDFAERLDARAAAVVELAEEIEARARSIIDLGERLDVRGEAVNELGERLHELGVTINDRGLLIAERAQAVVDRGGEVVATLPTLERAIGLIEPLEGAVERLGRMADLLPGARRSAAAKRGSTKAADDLPK